MRVSSPSNGRPSQTILAKWVIHVHILALITNGFFFFYFSYFLHFPNLHWLSYQLSPLYIFPMPSWVFSLFSSSPATSKMSDNMGEFNEGLRLPCPSQLLEIMLKQNYLKKNTYSSICLGPTKIFLPSKNRLTQNL